MLEFNIPLVIYVSGADRMAQYFRSLADPDSTVIGFLFYFRE